MTTHNDRAYLMHIAQAIATIQRHIGDLSYDEFTVDEKTSDAVIRQFMIIGEAANKVSDHYKKKQADVPWHLIIGMRNQLVHGYFDIDLDMVWNTVNQDLPLLKETIIRIFGFTDS